MGKANWSENHYEAAKRALGPNLSVKISNFSDNYDPSGKYAGVIMYHWRGQFSWRNEHLGYNGRAFYVAILDTRKWPQDAFRRAGQGMVHDYIFKQTFGESYNQNTASCGGFAIVEGQLKFSSLWLNKTESTSYANKWYSDGKKELSAPEQELVKFAVEEWKRHGKHRTATIPDWLDQKLSGKAAHQAVYEVGDVVKSLWEGPIHGKPVRRGDRGVVEDATVVNGKITVDFGGGKRACMCLRDIAHAG